MLPADLRVRGLGPGDTRALVRLINRCDAAYRGWAPADWRPPNSEPEDLRLDERLRDPECWSCGAFDADDRLVAAVIWEPFKGPERGESTLGVAYVSAVFVDPARGREGIATVLLSRAEATMHQRGYHLARLWTPEGGPARGFYETNGWRHDGQRMWHDRMQLHHVGYEKRLTP